MQPKHKFIIDIETGEILSHYHIYPYISDDHPLATVRKPPQSALERFKEWQATLILPEATQELVEAYRSVQDGLSALLESIPESVQTTEQKPKKGRPRVSTFNPIAAFMETLNDRGFNWVEDIVTGSTITSAKLSGSGVCNCSPSDVYAALYLYDISTESVKRLQDGKRKAERVSKAARHASHGLTSYIIRRPDLLAQLQAEVNIEREFRGLSRIHWAKPFNVA